MWFKELCQRWMGQAPRQRRRSCRSFRIQKPFTLEALEERTLLSNPATTGDLIAAINSANSSGTPTTITLKSGTIFNFISADNSTNGANALPVITGNITIVGNGDTLVRTGTAPFRLFDVASSGSLNLQDLKLQGGLVQGTGAVAAGGAIFNSGTLKLSGVTIQANEARGSDGAKGVSGNGEKASGGGLFVAGGSVSLDNDTFRSNIAQGGDGLDGSTRADGGNGGDGAGGGIFVAGGSVSLRKVLLSSNHVFGGDGGKGGTGGNSVASGAFGGSAGFGLGGGLYAASTSNITLTNDTLSNNIAQGGDGGVGGVGLDGSAGFGGGGGEGGTGFGGGLYLVVANSVSLSNDTFSNNFAFGGDGGDGGTGGDGTDSSGGFGGLGGSGGEGLGGGLFAEGGAITLSNDTLSGNAAAGGSGAPGGHGGHGDSGIFGGGNGGPGGSGGSGGRGAGGSLYVAVGTITLRNDTLDGNEVVGGLGGLGGDGGNAGLPLLADFSPSTGGNGGAGGAGGDAEGGGVFISLNNAALSLANTLIAESQVFAALGGAGGTGGVGDDDGANGVFGSHGNASGADVSGSVISSDHDLIGDTDGSSGFSTANGDILNPSSIGLAPLADNGGPTQTMALLPGSPAIDAGDSHAPGLPATDQRGFARIVGSAVDIGAFEFGGIAAAADLSLRGSVLSSAAPGGQITYTLTLTNNSASAQSNVALTDLLPANTTLVSWTAAPGWSSDAPPPGSSSGTVSAWIDTLDPNRSATLTLVVQVASGTPLHTVLNNIVSFAPFSDVDNAVTNSVNLSTTVLYAPTVSVTDAGGIYSGTPFPASATAVGIDGTTPVAGSFSFTYYAGTSASGTPLSTAPVNASTYMVVASFTSSDPDYMGGSAQTSFTIAQATTALSNLTMQQIIVGTKTTTVSGQLASNTIAIPVGQDVAITLHGVTHSATVAADGSFSASFATGNLAVGTYPIRYSYAGDSNFTPVSGSGSLTAAYGTQLLFDNSKPVPLGAVLPVKLALTNAAGTDISSSSIAVTAVGLVDSNGNAMRLRSAGNANPNNLFRYDATLGGYIFNLDTTGLTAGTYTLYYEAGKDPTRHSLTFMVD